MITLTADEAMLATLRQAHGLAEVRDARGMIVGFFAPVSLERAFHLHLTGGTGVPPVRSGGRPAGRRSHRRSHRPSHRPVK